MEEFPIDFIQTKRKANPNRILIYKQEENITRVKRDVSHNHVYMNLFYGVSIGILTKFKKMITIDTFSNFHKKNSITFAKSNRRYPL